MSPGEAGLLLAGLVLIALLYADIFLTVLHPAVESPMSNRFQRAIWQGLKGIGRLTRVPARRHIVLNLGLPLMVAGLIVFWLLLLVVGFACVYTPWIGDPAHFGVDKPLDGGFVDALYYSGVTLATLGYGDILPLTAGLRMIAVLQALTGAVTISAVVAYILAVYPALAQQRTIARTLNAEVAGQADGIPMLRRYLAGEGRWQSDLFIHLRELALNLLSISESHETHPVLYYAHARHVQHSFVRVLVTAQSLVGSLRYCLAVEEHAEMVHNPHLLFLEQALHYSLNQLNASVHITLGRDRAPSDAGEYRRAYGRTCAELEQIGLCSSRGRRAAPVLIGTEAEEDAGRDGEQRRLAAEALEYHGEPDMADPALDLGSATAEEAYMVYCQQTDPLIAAYAHTCGYSLEEARASTTTTWWMGRGTPGLQP